MTDELQERLGKAAVVIRRLKERIATLEHGAGREPIAIVGMGCRFPGGADGLAAYWRLLVEGRDGVVALADRWARLGEVAGDEVPRWAGLIDGVDAFDAGFFGISPREAASLDPQQRLLLEVGWEALEDAGVPPHGLAGSRTGVFVGACVSDYGRLVADRRGEAMDAYAVTGNLLSVAAGRLAYTWGLQGPCVTVDTACSSSLAAVHLACRSLRTHECGLALAGGVNVMLSAAMMGALGRTQALAPDGRCKTFDAQANGFARGEGCGVVVLKRLSDAVRDGDRVWAVIRGSAINQDGRSTGLTAPNVLAQEALLREALRDADVAAERVGYVEAHGTGTSLGDPIEVEALRAVLGAVRADGSRCLLGAVKTNLGHLEAAAGIAGLIKTALALHHRWIPRNLHFRVRNPRVRVDGTALALASEATQWPRGALPRVAGVSAFGMSGTNVHAVLEEAPERGEAEGGASRREVHGGREAEGTSRRVEVHAGRERVDVHAARGSAERAALVVLSARSPAALMAGAERLLAQVEGSAEHTLAAVAASLASTRSPLSERLAIVADSKAGLQAALAGAARGELPVGAVRGRAVGRPRVVFVFPGQGGQWTGMARQLLADEPVFREAIEACDAAISGETGWSVIAALQGDVEAAPIDVVQPALFAVSVGLAALWQAWGITPDAVVGHSMGEVAAAYVAGALTLADAAAVICRRSRLLRRISGQGEMALVELPIDAAAAALVGFEDRLAVAVSNSARSTVLAGEPAALAAVLAGLERRGVFCRRVKVDVASHSPQVDPLRPAMLAALADVRPQAARVAMRSTVIDAAVDGTGLDAAYWFANLREPVRFAAAVGALLGEGEAVFVEMGPHPVLTPAIQDITGGGSVALASLRRGQPERAALLEALAAAWVRGVAPGWSAVLTAGPRVRLPTYAWQRERHWISGAGRREPVGRHPLLGPMRSLSTDPGTRVWERSLDAGRLPWLADHRVRGVVVFPGAGYLEMLLAAAEERLGGPAELRGAAFVEPLVFVGDEAASVQVVAAAGRVQVASEGPGGWVVHATAAIAPAGELTEFDREVHTRLVTSEPGQVVIAALAGRGLDYGPAFRGLAELRRGAGEALARVELPEAAGGDAGYRLHPALLDACFHAMIGALPDGGADAWLPVEVAVVRAARRPVGPVWCHVRVVATAREDRRAADFVIVDEAGTVAEIQGLVVQRLADARAEAWLLAPAWPTVPRPAAKIRGGRFVLLGGGELAAGLADALLSAGHDVVQATSVGEASADGVTVDGVTAVVDLRGLAADLFDATTGLVRAVQAATAGSRPPRLWVVTRGAQAIDGDVDVAAEQAAQIGLARTVALEHPELRCICIDLDPARPHDVVGLLAELLADDDEQEVALRGAARHVGRVVRRAAPGGHGPQLRGDRTYLISGGLGGLGLAIAGWLAARGAGHLVLLGRAGVTTEAQRIAIAELSVPVTVARVDVAAREQLAPLLATIAASDRPLAGVVHAAGVLADGLLAGLDGERLRAVLAPKAGGALLLDELTRDAPLELFVLYASGAGLLGSPGQAGYAAANAVLDAVAQRRRARGLPALSVDWGLFADVGLAAAAGRGDRLAARGGRSLDVAEAHALLPMLLADGAAQVGVVPLDVAAWTSLIPAVLGLARLAPLIGAAPATADDDLAAALADASAGRAGRVREALRRRVARVLRLAPDRLDDAAPLISLGLDSLMGLELKHRLKRDAGVDVAMTGLLRDTSVARLVELVLARTPEPAGAPPPDAWTDIEL